MRTESTVQASMAGNLFWNNGEYLAKTVKYWREYETVTG